jgi:hypothetical protein
MAWISCDIGQVLEEYSMEDAGGMKVQGHSLVGSGDDDG